MAAETVKRSSRILRVFASKSTLTTESAQYSRLTLRWSGTSRISLTQSSSSRIT